MTVPGGHHPGEFEHLVELFPGVLFGIITGLGLVDAVFQERDGGVHLAPLAFRHDDTKRLHHVLQGLEAVAPITDDMHPADHAPGDQLAQAGRDVRSADIEKPADFFGVERARRANSKAWTWAMVRLMPQAWPISPQ